MMIVLIGLVVAGLVPLSVAAWRNRQTSLLHALVWAMLAWLAWGVAFFFDDARHDIRLSARSFALCLTGCAGVAVLGARRPHVLAWDFVVLGLLSVMLLPLLETWVIGTQSLDGLRLVFLAGTIAVGILNYLPTRLFPVALVMIVICAGEMGLVFATDWLGPIAIWVFDVLLTIVPWMTWALLRRSDGERSEFDRLWLDFRDGWGFVWAQRVRDQFDHAARNAGLSMKLSWCGLEVKANDSVDQAKAVATLRALLQRFAAPDQNL